ncbi:MAG: amino acid adenylation domain-containing protein [Candidatus Sulfotelmatobacter sp.]|jgi:amino acid adenylation domain-containing protein
MTPSTLDLHPSPAQEAVFFPASFGQQRLWFIDQFTPGSATYNMPSALRIRGELSVEVLERTLQELTRRHETLRTRFVAVGGQPQQVIEDEVKVELPVLDLTWILGEEKREAEAMRLALEEAKRPFDLQQTPLFRAKLLRLGGLNHVLLFTMHHIISDAWSIGVLVGEVSVLYGAFSAGRPSPLPELPIQYADYSMWQRECLESGVLERQLAYWTKQLAGSSLLKLPTDRPRPATQSQKGAICHFVIAADLTQKLKQLAEQQGATLFMVLLAAFQTLLHRYSGQDDIAVGTPIAGRSNSAAEKLIGFFVNTLVLRADLSGAPNFTELLRRTKEVTLGAYAHQDVPFEKLVEVLSPERDMSRAPLFQVMLVMWNTPWSELELGGAKLQPLSVERGISRFDLSMTLDVGTGQGQEGLRGSLEYSTDLFEAATITRMIDHYSLLLRSIISDSHAPIHSLEILSPEERHILIEDFNATTASIPEKTVTRLFEEQVDRTPNATAVQCGEDSLSYIELNHRANQLARRLRELGVGPETRVGLMVERSLEMVVGLLGILKAGGAYVPLDTDYPAERLAFMLEDTEAPLILTQSHVRARVPESKARVLELDADWAEIAIQSMENIASASEPQNAAYVIYTSGSTGWPKGVVVTQRGLSNHMQWMQTAYVLTPADRVLQKTAFSFDASVWEFFWPLLVGARLIMAPPGAHRDPALLIQEIVRQEVTILQVVPSFLWALAAEGELRNCKTLSRIFAGGEVLTNDLVLAVTGQVSVAVTNLYGPTEATVDATAWDWQRHNIDETRAVPIGRPIANTQAYVLDLHMQPVPIGVEGELYLGGAGQARGYLNRPGLTAEKFVPNPFSRAGGERLYRTGDLVQYQADGSLEFLGRLDNQVKIRGYRIELGEIEVALLDHPGVARAAVLAREDQPGDKRLVAYVVGRGEAEKLEDGHLRSYLQQRVPEYMVPRAYVQLESLPLTANGKLDHKALPAPEGDAYGVLGYEAPVGEIETALAAIWAELLKVERVGRHDNFFALGGHSLLDIQMRTMIRKRFHYDLPLAQLFQRPCIAELAKLLEPVPEQLPSSVLVGIQPPMTTPTLPTPVPVEIQPRMTTTMLPKDRKDNGPEGKSAKWIADVTGKRLDRWIRLAQQIAGELPPGSAVLDVAPGPGYLCIELAKLGYAVSGLDISHTLVEIANRNAAEAGVAVDFRQGSASSMPFADDTFDFLHCSGAFKQFGQPVGALQEMYRVLKPGGRGMIGDLRRDASWRALNQAVDTWGLPLFDRILAKFSFQFLVRKEAYTKNQFQRMLTQTKFRRIEIKENDIEFEVSAWK